MDALSVLVNAQLSWHAFRKILALIIEASGTDMSDNLGHRQVWAVFGVQIVAFDSLELEDDQGILFSEFKFQVELTATLHAPMSETERYYVAVARYVAVRLKAAIEGDVQLVRNLQTVIPIDDSGS